MKSLVVSSCTSTKLFENHGPNLLMKICVQQEKLSRIPNMNERSQYYSQWSLTQEMRGLEYGKMLIALVSHLPQHYAASKGCVGQYVVK